MNTNEPSVDEAGTRQGRGESARRLTEVALFACLVIGATWPLARDVASQAPGSNLWERRIIHFETPVNLWNLWWFRHSVVELRQSPFDCTYLFYPIGADLSLHTLSLVPASVAMLMQPAVGLVATYNLLLLASFVLAGMSAAALARRLGLAGHAAMLSGAIYAFSPAVFAHLYAGHFELLWTFWIPAVLLAFLRVVDASGEERGWARAWLLGLTIAGAAYTSPYYALYSVELIAVVVVIRWRAILRPRVVKRMMLAALVAAIAVAPFAIRLAEGAQRVRNADVIRRDFREFSMEPASFLVPSFMHPVLAAPLVPLHERMNVGRAMPQETTGYLGFTVLVLAALCLARQRRHAPVRPPGPVIERRLAAAIAGTFLVLSLGAELKIHGVPTGFPLPAAALAEIPLARLARAPGRHVVVAMLGLSVLAAAGWERTGRRWRAIVIVLMAFEYWPRVPLMPTAVPAVYERIAREPDTFAVMDVPPGVRDGSRVLGRPDAERLLAQTVHRKPIIDGMASRLSDWRWGSIVSAPLVGSLLDPVRMVPPSPAGAEAYFTRWRIRAIVLHPEASPEARRLIESSLLVERRERFDGGIELWWVR